MNPTPITGSVNEKGMFTAKNPYKYPSSEWIKWNEDNLGKPQLLTYTPSNVLVTDEEHVEVVGPVWQFRRNPYTGSWLTLAEKDKKQYDGFLGFTNDNKPYQTRQVYITIPPTEKPKHTCWHVPETSPCEGCEYEQNYHAPKLTDAKPFKAIDQYYDVFNQAWMDNGEGIENWKEQGFQTRTIPEAHPLEGVKTAEAEHIIPHGKKRCDFTLEDWREVASECEAICSHQSISILQLSEKLDAFDAQFATDAGGGKESAEVVLRKHVPHCIWGDEGGTSFMLDTVPATLIIKAMEEYKAPSTHSSSEMVEVDKVCSILWKEMKYNPSLYIAIADKIRSCVK